MILKEKYQQCSQGTAVFHERWSDPCVCSQVLQDPGTPHSRGGSAATGPTGDLEITAGLAYSCFQGAGQQLDTAWWHPIIAYDKSNVSSAGWRYLKRPFCGDLNIHQALSFCLALRWKQTSAVLGGFQRDGIYIFQGKSKKSHHKQDNKKSCTSENHSIPGAKQMCF